MASDAPRAGDLDPEMETGDVPLAAVLTALRDAVAALRIALDAERARTSALQARLRALEQERDRLLSRIAADDPADDPAGPPRRRSGAPTSDGAPAPSRTRRPPNS